MKFGIVILSAVFRLSAAARGSPALSKHRLKEIGKIVAAKSLEPATLAAAISLLLPALLLLARILFIFLAMLPVFSVLIILFSLFGIAEHLVGLIQLLKLFIGLGVVGVQVGVIFTRKLSISIFYILVRSFFIET